MNRQPIVVHEPSKPLFTRLLALLVCQIVVWQPLVATAAPLAQQPMFTVSSVPANVMLMMDDSSSMARYRLPTPPGLTIPVGNQTVRYNAGTRVMSAADFTLRAPAFNPLWYNPTVTYEKWNDDNKPDPAPGNKLPAAGRKLSECGYRRKHRRCQRCADHAARHAVPDAGSAGLDFAGAWHGGRRWYVCQLRTSCVAVDFQQHG